VSDSNLSVKITADVAQLQTKFAIARAEVNGLTSEMNKLAKASAQGIIDPAGSARLQQVAGDMLHARQTTAGLAGELEKAGISASSMGARSGEAQLHVATLGREFRKLGEELKSGSMAGADVTLLRLGQHLLGLGPAALIGVGAVAGLAGGLAYLTIEGIKASNALDQAFLGAQFAGNLEISRASLKQFSDEMAKTKGISASDAAEITASFAKIPGITTPMFHALTAEVADFAAQTGQTAPKAAEELAKVFNQKTSAAEFARSIGGIYQSQINMAEAADRSGDAVKEQEAKFAILLSTIGRSTTTIDENKNKITASIGSFLGYTAALASGNTAEEINADILARSNLARQQQLEILRQTASQLGNTKQSPEETLKTGVGAADKENPVARQVEDAKSKIAEMNAALVIAQQTGQQVSIDKLTAGLQKANENLSALQFGPVLARMRDDMAQVAATWDGTQSGLLAKQIQISRATLADVQQNSKERVQVETEVAHLQVQQRQAAGSELIAQARAEAATITGETGIGAIQRLEKERAVWVQTLTGDRLTAAQRLEVARTLNSEYAAINKETAAQASAIARSNADTDIAIAKLTIESKKASLELDVQANKISAAAKYQILKDLTTQEAALNQQQLQSELSLLNQGTAEYARVMNQERELKAKLNLDLAQLDKQRAADAAKEAKTEATTWKSAVGEIENAEGMLVSNLLSKRKSLSQSLVQIGGQLVQKEIENDIKAMTTKLLLAKSEEASKKALEQGGLLYHLLTETQKTGATATGETARTVAATAGDTARLGVQATTAVASKAISKTTGSSTVMADAAKAFSGTYAAVAQIPLVGPYIAPAAASAAYVAVAAYSSLASLDTGTNYVPRNMIAQIHEGEAIVPKQYNPAANGGSGSDGAAGRNGAAGKGGGGDTHNYGDINMTDTNMKRLLSGRAGQRMAFDAAKSAYRRGAR
jgi:hypothetical protein